MSDQRLTATCTCGATCSSSSTPEWITDHLDEHPEHLITVTRSGTLP